MIDNLISTTKKNLSNEIYNKLFNISFEKNFRLCMGLDLIQNKENNKELLKNIKMFKEVNYQLVNLIHYLFEIYNEEFDWESIKLQTVKKENKYYYRNYKSFDYTITNNDSIDKIVKNYINTKNENHLLKSLFLEKTVYDKIDNNIYLKKQILTNWNIDNLSINDINNSNLNLINRIKEYYKFENNKNLLSYIKKNNIKENNKDMIIIKLINYLLINKDNIKDFDLTIFTNLLDSESLAKHLSNNNFKNCIRMIFNFISKLGNNINNLNLKSGLSKLNDNLINNNLLLNIDIIEENISSIAYYINSFIKNKIENNIKYSNKINNLYKIYIEFNLKLEKLEKNNFNLSANILNKYSNLENNLKLLKKEKYFLKKNKKSIVIIEKKKVILKSDINWFNYYNFNTFKPKKNSIASNNYIIWINYEMNLIKDLDSDYFLKFNISLASINSILPIWKTYFSKIKQILFKNKLYITNDFMTILKDYIKASFENIIIIENQKLNLQDPHSNKVQKHINLIKQTSLLKNLDYPWVNKNINILNKIINKERESLLDSYLE